MRLPLAGWRARAAALLPTRERKLSSGSPRPPYRRVHLLWNRHWSVPPRLLRRRQLHRRPTSLHAEPTGHRLPSGQRLVQRRQMHPRPAASGFRRRNHDRPTQCPLRHRRRRPLKLQLVPEHRRALGPGKWRGWWWRWWPGSAKPSPGPPGPPPPDQCQEPLPDVGDLSNQGDPINVVSQSSRHDVKDFSLRGSIAEFSFNRSYVSSEKTWAHETSLGTLDGPFLPKPFGSSPKWAASLRWWHSLYSFVFPQGWIANASLWSVREGNGRLLDFVACSDGNTSCFATPTRRFSETRAKLYWQATGGGNGTFILFKDNSRSVFADVWTPPVSGPGKRHFLSRIEDGQYPVSGGAPRVLSQLSYAVPDPGCPGQSTVGNPGVPYVATVTTEDGAQVRFHYRFVATFRPSPAQECVLASVSLADRSDGGEPTLVQYTYATDAGIEAAGLLASSRWPAVNAGIQAYRYEHSAPYDNFTIVDNGNPLTQHTSIGESVLFDNQYSPSNGLLNTFVNMTQTQSSVRCDGGTLSPFCESAAVQNLAFSTMSFGGDYTGTQVAAPRDYLLETTSQSMGRRVKGYTDSCLDNQCANSSPGTVSWVFNQLPSSNFVTQAVQDKRSFCLAYGYAVPQSLPADAGFLLPVERTAVYK